MHQEGSKFILIDPSGKIYQLSDQKRLSRLPAPR